MSESKSINEFTMKDWKNTGIFFVFAGLITIFIAKEWKLGGEP